METQLVALQQDCFRLETGKSPYIGFDRGHCLRKIELLVITRHTEISSILTLWRILSGPPSQTSVAQATHLSDLTDPIRSLMLRPSAAPKLRLAYLAHWLHIVTPGGCSAYLEMFGYSF